jgi:hypothetical protein
MAATTLANIDFNSSTWKDIVLGEFTQKLGLLSSGLLMDAGSAIDSLDKGYTVTMPHWDTLSGEMDVITTSLTTTVNSLATYKDIAVWCEREKAWGADQMVRVVSGADPAAEVARQIAEYLANELHKIAINVLAGVFSVELATSHSTGTQFSGANIDIAGVQAARLLQGDNMENLKIALLNSKPYSDALLSGLITNTVVQGVANEQYRSGMVGQLLGMNPVMTDKLTATASVYPSYFGAPGAMVYKFRERPVSSETNANITRVSVGGLIFDIEKHRVALTAGGQDVLIIRFSGLAHVPGVQWDGTVVSNPTNTQLATASSWTKVATDNKLIRIVQLNTL